MVKFGTLDSALWGIFRHYSKLQTGILEFSAPSEMRPSCVILYMSHDQLWTPTTNRRGPPWSRDVIWYAPAKSYFKNVFSFLLLFNCDNRPITALYFFFFSLFGNLNRTNQRTNEHINERLNWGGRGEEKFPPFNKSNLFEYLYQKYLVQCSSTIFHWGTPLSHEKGFRNLLRDF